MLLGLFLLGVFVQLSYRGADETFCCTATREQRVKEKKLHLQVVHTATSQLHAVCRNNRRASKSNRFKSNNFKVQCAKFLQRVSCSGPC